MKQHFFVVLACMAMTAFGQSTSQGVKSQQFKVSLLVTPSVEYEVGLTKYTTLGLGIDTQLAFREATGRKTEFGAFLIYEAFYRYYYNFNRRIRKQKNIQNNSANYISLISSFLTSNSIIGTLDASNDYYVFLGPIWGLQRTYGAGFNWGLELGVGTAFTDGEQIIQPNMGLSIGWVFL